MQRSPRREMRSPCHRIIEEKECNETTTCWWNPSNNKCSYKRNRKLGKTLEMNPDIADSVVDYLDVTDLYRQYGLYASQEILSRLPLENMDELHSLMWILLQDREIEFIQTILYYLDNRTYRLNDDELFEGPFFQLFQQLNRIALSEAQSGNFELLLELVRVGITDLNSHLLTASELGDIELIRQLVDHGASNLNTALHIAGRHGQIEAIRELIRLGGTAVHSALESAAFNGHLEIVRELLTYQIHPVHLRRVLRIARRQGRSNATIVEELLRAGATD